MTKSVTWTESDGPWIPFAENKTQEKMPQEHIGTEDICSRVLEELTLFVVSLFHCKE